MDACKAAGVHKSLALQSLKRKGATFESSDEDVEEINPKRKVKADPKDKDKNKDPNKENKSAKLKLDDATIQALDANDHDSIALLAQKLSAGMHTTLINIKGQFLQFQQTMYATPAKTKELKADHFLSWLRIACSKYSRFMMFCIRVCVCFQMQGALQTLCVSRY